LNPKRRQFNQSSQSRDYPYNRGAMIRHEDFGICYIGDHPKEPSFGALRDVHSGDLISLHVDPDKCKFIRFISWIFNEKDRPNTS
jgi:hypothetical protein